MVSWRGCSHGRGIRQAACPQAYTRPLARPAVGGTGRPPARPPEHRLTRRFPPHRLDARSPARRSPPTARPPAARPAGRAATAAVLAAVRERAFEPPPEHVAELAGGEGVAGLVFDLLRLKLLPVIVFNFDRHLCQRLAEALVGYLEVCNTYFEGALQLVVSCNTLGRARWPAACAYHVGCWHQRVYSPNPALPLPSQRCEAEFRSNNES